MYTLPEQIGKAIANIFDKFDDHTVEANHRHQNNTDLLNDSALYLSSNWSTGEGGCIPYFDMFDYGDNPSLIKTMTHH